MPRLPGRQPGAVREEHEKGEEKGREKEALAGDGGELNSEMGHKLICIQHSTCRSDERGRAETMPVDRQQHPIAHPVRFQGSFRSTVTHIN